MSESLTALLIRFRRDPNGRATQKCPVLVWAAPALSAGEHWEKTRGLSSQGPVAGDPRIFQVEKNPKASNTFPFGVTLGRVDSNDLVLDDTSVSRFHAYLQQLQGAWVVTDAESRNGTSVDGVKLTPNQTVPVHDGSMIRFGDAELKFMLPASFLAMLDSLETQRK